MKKFLLAAVFLILFLVVGYVETHYTLTCKVIEINGSLITIEDSTGNLWDFYGEDYKVGSSVKATFFTACTDQTREDDKIVKIK